MSARGWRSLWPVLTSGEVLPLLFSRSARKRKICPLLWTRCKFPTSRSNRSKARKPKHRMGRAKNTSEWLSKIEPLRRKNETQSDSCCFTSIGQHAFTDLPRPGQTQTGRQAEKRSVDHACESQRCVHRIR